MVSGAGCGFMETILVAIRRVATSLLLIVVVALAARLGFAWNQGRKIPQEVIGQAAFYQETGNIAYSLTTGKGFSSPFRRETGPTAWLTPVYPLLVAGVFRVFGIFSPASFFAVVGLNSLFSSAACIPLFLAGRKIGGVGAGAGAAWLWALYPQAVMMPFEWVWDTCLTAFLGALLLWATLKLAGSAPRSLNWCVYGLLWGFTLMTNPSLGSLLPFLLGWAAVRARSREKLSWKYPALALGVSVLCCVPWTVRNFMVFNKLVPLRSNFALELYIGNNNNYASRQFVWPPKITKEREILRYFRIGETAFMEEEKRKALEFIHDHPDIFLSLSVDRFVAFWSGIVHPLEAWKKTGSEQGSSAADRTLVRLLMVCSSLTALGALLGIVVLLTRRSVYWFPAACYPLVFPWIYYITHPNQRYRHPIDPINLLLTAMAVAAATSLLLHKFLGSSRTNADKSTLNP